MKSQARRYLFVLPWAKVSGSGVNAVVCGLWDAMTPDYQPEILVTGWTRPPADHHWLKLYSMEGGPRERIVFLLKLPLTLFRLWRLIRGAVAVNSHFPALECLALAILRRLHLSPPLIFSVHGMDVHSALQSSGLARVFYRWMFASADLVVACSAALGGSLTALGVKSEVVWNGTSPPPAVIGDRHVPGPYIVCVAAYVKKKAQSVLLDAFAEVSRHYPAVRLICIGGEAAGESERPLLAAQAERLGISSKIDMLVDVPHEQIWRWIKYAECLVLPSREEPFGIVLLEAGQLKVPVVATRVGGIPEFLTNGVHGLLCEPDRPDLLAEAILSVLTQPEIAHQRAEAFCRVASQLTWERAWHRYQQLANL